VKNPKGTLEVRGPEGKLCNKQKNSKIGGKNLLPTWVEKIIINIFEEIGEYPTESEELSSNQR